MAKTADTSKVTRRHAGRSSASTDAAGAPSLIFHKQIEALDPKRHGQLALASKVSYGFARETNWLPLNASEFGSASRHYPILFREDEQASPIAVVGVHVHQNLFVEDGDDWAEGCYVPAFVRRYPFLIAQHETGGRTLCADVESELLRAGEGRPLYVDEKPTELLQGITRFCMAFAGEQDRTKRVCAALVENDLLVERTVQLTLPDGHVVAMRGFRVIDETRLRGLSEATLAEWGRNGWLACAVAHGISMGNFGRLYYRSSRQPLSE